MAPAAHAGFLARTAHTTSELAARRGPGPDGASRKQEALVGYCNVKEVRVASPPLPEAITTN